jgi:hypothetical protein
LVISRADNVDDKENIAEVECYDLAMRSIPPLEVFFRDFHRVNGLLIAARREIKGNNQTVRFDDVKILPEVPNGAFALP